MCSYYVAFSQRLIKYMDRFWIWWIWRNTTLSSECLPFGDMCGFVGQTHVSDTMIYYCSTLWHALYHFINNSLIKRWLLPPIYHILFYFIDMLYEISNIKYSQQSPLNSENSCSGNVFGCGPVAVILILCAHRSGLGCWEVTNGSWSCRWTHKSPSCPVGGVSGGGHSAEGETVEHPLVWKNA